MSEFQYIGFRAIDGPLSDKQLQYMEKQSSRAEITRWSFDNTYHYGDFRGNAVEMLQRGYDVHLHYANFGIRTLMLRLPQGLPVSGTRRSPYIDGESVVWKTDAKGPAGILTISATTDPDALDELWDVDEYLNRVVNVRQQLIDGDVRPLYVAWMCGCQSEEVDFDDAKEPPVPAGLAKSGTAIGAMLEFFGLSPFLLAAAAETSPHLAEVGDPNVAMAEWLKSIDATTLRDWMLRFLTDEADDTKRKCLQAFRQSHKPPSWPVTKGTRTFAELLRRADELAESDQIRKEKRKQQARRKRLADMAKSPQKYLEEVNTLVAQRTRSQYDEAAQVLSDIREAVGGKEGEKITHKHAAHLKKKHPTLNLLTGALRRQGLLP